MKFLNGQQPLLDLTYNDIFLVPGYSDIKSRFEVDLTPTDLTGANIPIVIANMTAVAGKRMSETIARRGGLTVLPQDIPFEVLEPMVRFIKSRDLVFETALTLGPENTINEALNIIRKRAYGAVIIVDKTNHPIGIFTEEDAKDHDLFTPLSEVMTKDVISLPHYLKTETIFTELQHNRLTVAPVVKNQKLLGVVTLKGALRSSIYQPAIDRNKQFMVAAAVGINGDVAGKVKKLLGFGVDIIVLDTAHGHQATMINAIKAARKIAKEVRIVAGNVVTASATQDLIQAGADIVKVGVGPGAMCTTRMMTGVGRPQFSAIMECAEKAHKLGGKIWADGGIRYPRDVALALAAGADNVMWGSMWAGTYESVGDVLTDAKGRLYKENYGMASKRAVKNRARSESAFEQARKQFFEEGISSSKLYLDPERPSAEDLVDYITAGVRSSLAYAGARSIAEFHEKAIVGLQSTAGYQEGKPVDTTWLD